MKTTLKIILFCSMFLTANAKTTEVNFDTMQNVFTSESINGDTLTKHKVFEIDDHLVICDTVIIEKQKIKTVVKEKGNFKGVIIATFALLFAVIAIYLKRKNNG